MTEYGAPIGWCCEEGLRCPEHIELMEQIHRTKKYVLSDDRVRAMTDDGLVEVKPFIPGQFYKTRSGEKVVYIGENTFVCEACHVFGKEDEDTFAVYKHGGFHIGSLEHDYDIIGEWCSEWKVTAYGEDVFTTKNESNASMYRSLGFDVEEV